MTERLSPAVLRQLLDYDPETGKLFWKKRDASWFADGKDGRAANAAKWNARFAGKEAIDSCSGSHGYLDGAILGVGILAHRVIFALLHDRWPVGVDHIDGDKWNNRPENLREATQAENIRNLRVRCDNPTGAIGVRRLRSGVWRAAIKCNGVREDLGSFATMSEAIAARKRAESRLKFHPNHGRP